MEAESLLKQQQEGDSKAILMDDDKIQVIGPPASRNVIDNLKKLLTKRQHSRESDAENFFSNKEATANSDLESEISFYSLLTSSTSDSDLDLRTSPDNRKSRRRQTKRNLSTSSSSSSSSLSPVRERRKRPKRGMKRYDLILEDWNAQNLTSKKLIPSGRARHSPISQLADNADPLTSSANIVNINIMVNPNASVEDGAASSSNKESTTDEEEDKQNVDASGRNGNNRTTRLRKTRRDRNKRRKHPGDKTRCGNHHHHHHRHNHNSHSTPEQQQEQHDQQHHHSQHHENEPEHQQVSNDKNSVSIPSEGKVDVVAPKNVEEVIPSSSPPQLASNSNVSETTVATVSEPLTTENTIE